MKYRATDGTLEKSYASLFNAITSADLQGQGFKVYGGSEIVYEQVTSYKRLAKGKSQVLKAAKTMTEKMATISSWFYSNSGCSGTFNDAIKSQNYKSNCATLANWVCRKLKVTKAGMYFYGKAGSIIQWRSNETEEAVRESCDVIRIGMTVKDALALKVLQPGDICLYAKQHTNVFAGGGKWYESGTVYANGSGAEGTPLHKFYGATVLYDWVISWVIRYNDPNYKIKGRQYRVQCGSFAIRANAKVLGNKVKKAGLPVTITQVNGEYVVQVGLFSLLGNAVKMYQDIINAGFDCMIKGV